MACPTSTRGFPALNPVTCMSREAFTIKLDIENPKIRLESLELPSLSLLNYQPLSQTISVTWSHHHHQPSLKIFNHFEVPDQMEASSSTSLSLRRRALLRCYCAKKLVLVVLWTANNPSRRFYGCPNYWVFQFEYFVLLGFSFFCLNFSLVVEVYFSIFLCFIIKCLVCISSWAKV